MAAGGSGYLPPIPASSPTKRGLPQVSHLTQGHKLIHVFPVSPVAINGLADSDKAASAAEYLFKPQYTVSPNLHVKLTNIQQVVFDSRHHIIALTETCLRSNPRPRKYHRQKGIPLGTCKRRNHFS